MCSHTIECVHTSAPRNDEGDFQLVKYNTDSGVRTARAFAINLYVWICMSPIMHAKEAYYARKRDLLCTQKSPIMHTQEPYYARKRALSCTQRSPSKEPYRIHEKRALE